MFGILSFIIIHLPICEKIRQFINPRCIIPNPHSHVCDLSNVKGKGCVIFELNVALLTRWVQLSLMLRLALMKVQSNLRALVRISIHGTNQIRQVWQTF